MPPASAASPSTPPDPPAADRRAPAPTRGEEDAPGTRDDRSGGRPTPLSAGRTQAWRLGVAAAAWQAVAGVVLWLVLAVIAGQVDPPLSANLGWASRGALLMTALGACVTLLMAAGAARRAAAAANALVGEIAALSEVEGRRRVEPPDLRQLAELDEVARAINRALAAFVPRLVQLERTGREQQAILQSLSNGLIAVDPEQRLISINRAGALMLGVDPAGVRGRLVQEVARQPGLNRFLRDAMAGAAPTEGEFAIERDGAGRRIVQAVSEPLRDADGRPAGVLVVLTDVTKLRRLESLRSDFAANVSHELRTPITNIKGYVDTLLQVGVEDREQAQRFLEIIHRNATRLGAIIEDLLALARLEHPGEHETIEPEDAPLRPLLENVKNQLESAAEAKELSLEVEVPATLRGRVLPSLVEQAVANLVSNAIAFSPPRGVVRIAARPAEKGMVEISVTDQGPGIPPHHAERIFERFYRVDRGRTRDHGGTGLGLAIVKHIALAHGGRVDLESKVGVGSTFRLRLPAAEDTATPSRGESSPPAAG